MKHATPSRRTLMAGIVTAIGSGLYAKAAWAFPSGTQGLVQAASRLLRRFGVSVAAEYDAAAKRDVLRFTVQPQDDIQYEHLTVSGFQLDTCWFETSFGDAVEFTNFDMSTGQPDLKMASQGGRSRIEILDPQAHVQVMIAGGATYELRDGVLVRVD
jgi:hypothetical protein